MDLLWTTLSEFPGEGPVPRGLGQGILGMRLYLVPPGSKSHFFLFFFFNFYLFIYLFLAVLGLLSCARAPSSYGKRGPLFIAVRGPLTVAASLVAEHRLQLRRLSSCGSRA